MRERVVARLFYNLQYCVLGNYALFCIKRSNFGAEAEGSQIFCDLRLKSVFKVFLNSHGIQG